MRALISLLLLATSFSLLADETVQTEVSMPGEVQWDYDGDYGLLLSLQTKRLLLRTILPRDLPDYCSLLSDPVAMEKFASGPMPQEKILSRFNNVWRARWKKNDPFSALAITLISADVDPIDYPIIGHIIMGHGDREGESSLAFVLFPEYWDKGYGKEAVRAVVQILAPELVKKHYGPANYELQEITATCRPDNLRSIKVLQAADMHQKGSVIEYGRERLLFSISLDEILHPAP